MSERRSRAPRFSRDSILFFTGLAGIIYETVTGGPVERPTLLLLFATMVGLPAFLRYDERKNRDRSK